MFHPISFAGFKLHSRLSSRSIDVEHESDVRDANADGERIQALDDLAIQFACRSLINSCGIEEPIGNYAYATFERGLDYLAHELAATGLKQKQLGLGCHARIMRRKLQKVADTFADRRAAGFARQEIRNIAFLKMRRKSVGLSRLSASF